MNKHYALWLIALLCTIGSVMALNITNHDIPTEYGYMWRGLNYTPTFDWVGNQLLNRWAINDVYTDVFNLPLWGYVLNSTHVEGLSHDVEYSLNIRDIPHTTARIEFNTINFNGTNEYLQIYGNVANYLSNSITEGFSFSTWIYVTEAHNGEIIRNRDNNYIQITSAGNLRSIITVDSTANTLTYALQPQHYNTWIHVATSVDLNNHHRLYLNNNLVAENVLSHTTVNSLNNWDIGRRYIGANYFFGFMKQAQIYHKPLTPTEISTIYSEGRNSQNPVRNNLIFDIHIDNINSTHLFDKHYTNFDENSYSYNFHKDYISFTNNEGILGNYDDQTISLWFTVPTKTPTSDGYLFGHPATTGNRVYIYQTTIGTIRANIGNQVRTIAPNNTYSTNTKNHVILQRHGNTNTMSAYFNGELVFFNESATISTLQNSTLYIGGLTSTQNHFSGTISNIQIFNYLLEESEIKTLYNSQLNNEPIPFYGMLGTRGDTITSTVYATNLTNVVSSNATASLTDLRVNITAIDAISTNPLSNFSGWVSDSYGNNHSYNISTGSYLAVFNKPDNNITSYLTSIGYATNIGTLLLLSALTTPTHSLQHDLYETNSVFIYLRDEATNQLITQEINITIMGDSFSQNYNTSTGLLVQSLTPGNYMIVASGGTYQSRTYNIEIVESESVIINVYLSPNAETTTFTFVDDFTNQVVQGVTFTVSRLINNVWTIVQVKESDISGKTTFTYTPYVRYFFTAQKTGYEDKTFELNPILFSQYDVRMTRSSTQDYQEETTGINIFISPRQYREAQNNVFILQIYSPSGRLNSYNYTLTYPGGSYTGSGNNAYGGMFTQTFNITSANINDRVRLTYYYTAGGETFSKSITYTIIQARSKSQGFMNLEDPTFGLGLAVRVLIAVGIVIVVTGVGGMIAGWVPGLVLGLMLQSLFMLTGFIDPWVGWLSLVVGFIVVMGVSRSG